MSEEGQMTLKIGHLGTKKLPGALKLVKAQKDLPKVITPDQRYEMARKAEETRIARHAELDRLRSL